MIEYLRSPTFWAIFAGSMALAAFLCPLLYQFSRGIGALDSSRRDRMRDERMPLLGGLAVAAPVLISCAVCLAMPTNMLRDLEPMRRALAVMALGGLAIAGAGVLDDLKGLRVWHKSAAALAVALCVCLFAGPLEYVSLPFWGRIDLGPVLGLILSILWLLLLTYSLLAFEGMDEIAAAISCLAAIALGASATLNGDTFVLAMCLALCGALYAFLVFNYPPSRLLLGSSGLLFIGYFIGATAMIGSQKTTAVLVFLLPAAILAAPVYIRLRTGRPGLGAESSGKAVRRPARPFWPLLAIYSLSCLALAILAVALLRASGPETAWWLSDVALIVYGGLVFLGLLAAGLLLPIQQALSRRRRASAIEAFQRFAADRLARGASYAEAMAILELAAEELQLRHIELWKTGEEDAPLCAIYPEDWPEGDLPIERLSARSEAGDEFAARIQFREDADSRMRECATDAIRSILQGAPAISRRSEHGKAPSFEAVEDEPAAGFSSAAAGIFGQWKRIKKRISI